MDQFKNIAAQIKYAVVSVESKSALNPILWLAGICAPIGLVGYILTRDSFFEALIAFPVVAAVLGFIWFSIRDPRQLRSENYLLEDRRLELMGEKNDEVDASRILAQDIIDIEPPKEIGESK